MKDVGRAHSQKVTRQSFAPFLNASAPQPPFLCSTRQPPTSLRCSPCSFMGESRGLRGTCPLRQMSTLASGGNLSQRQVGAGRGFSQWPSSSTRGGGERSGWCLQRNSTGIWIFLHVFPFHSAPIITVADGRILGSLEWNNPGEEMGVAGVGQRQGQQKNSVQSGVKPDTPNSGCFFIFPSLSTSS